MRNEEKRLDSGFTRNWKDSFQSFVDTSDFFEFNENQINNRTNSPIAINNNVPSVLASLKPTKLKWIKTINECKDAVKCAQRPITAVKREPWSKFVRNYVVMDDVVYHNDGWWYIMIYYMNSKHINRLKLIFLMRFPLISIAHQMLWHVAIFNTHVQRTISDLSMNYEFIVSELILRYDNS